MTAKEIKRIMFVIIKGILEGEKVPNCEDLGIEQEEYFEIVSLMKNEGLLNSRLVSLDLSGNAYIMKRIDAVSLYGIKFMEENEPLNKIYNSVKEIKTFVFGK